jgi:hypothetical protein
VAATRQRRSRRRATGSGIENTCHEIGPALRASRDARSKNGDARTNVIADYLKEHFLSKGKLGCKTGEGAATYPDPEYFCENFIDPGLRPKRDFKNIPYSLPGENRESR